jgi:hypothetical protein
MVSDKQLILHTPALTINNYVLWTGFHILLTAAKCIEIVFYASSRNIMFFII